MKNQAYLFLLAAIFMASACQETKVVTKKGAMTIAYLFYCKNVPLSWTGEVPRSIFTTRK